MKIVQRDINDLIPAEYNPRYISDADFEQLKASIQRFDAVEPVIVNMHPERKNIIISGHQRIMAAHALKMKTFPCVELSLDQQQEKELNIRMNQNTGAWDWDKLANFFEVDELTDWGFAEGELLGFGQSGNKWHEYDRSDTDGDNIEEIIGYNASSMWYGMPRSIDGISDKMVALPSQEGGNPMKDKYSRTVVESIRRIVVTYMRPGDFFLENCCGWSTFGAIAKMHGYSGIGVDIWDTAIEYSERQIKNIGNAANVDIVEMDGMDLSFDDNKFDFVYCNPPFAAVEKYSGKENDIADDNPDKFIQKLTKLCSENKRVLKKDGLCTMTIADYRTNGILRPMGNILITAGISIGFSIHDIVISENVGIAQVLRKKSIEKKRTAKNHEYVITFKK